MLRENQDVSIVLKYFSLSSILCIRRINISQWSIVLSHVQLCVKIERKQKTAVCNQCIELLNLFDINWKKNKPMNLLLVIWF